MPIARHLSTLLPVTFLLLVAPEGCARRPVLRSAQAPLPRGDAGLPPGAAALMPRLQSIFASEGAPPELAWIAEAESGLNPHIQGNYGGRGYFQLTRQTARSLGLRTFWPDDRLDPERSARAAARRLRALRDRFGSWPLALAAYNAGEGRVARAIAAAHSRSFGPVAAALPPTTRGYVPRVLALVERRTGVSLDEAADSK